MAKVGRPVAFETVEELQELIDGYFDYCDELLRRDDDGKVVSSKPYTMTGLARAIGVDRRTLLNYSHKEDFFPLIKAAKSRVEEYAEERLFGNTQVAGSIFTLKNNHGWKDKQEIDHSGSGITFTYKKASDADE